MNNHPITALEIAARCWSDPSTEHLQFNLDLAQAFAKRIDVLLTNIEIAHDAIKYAPLSLAHPLCGQELWAQQAKKHRATFQRLLKGLNKDGTPL